jgi:hypothetical protein
VSSDWKSRKRLISEELQMSSVLRSFDFLLKAKGMSL